MLALNVPRAPFRADLVRGSSHIGMEKMLRLKLGQHLPKSTIGAGISYTLSLWPQLMRFGDDGRDQKRDRPLERSTAWNTALSRRRTP